MEEGLPKLSPEQKKKVAERIAFEEANSKAMARASRLVAAWGKHGKTAEEISELLMATARRHEESARLFREDPATAVLPDY